MQLTRFLHYKQFDAIQLNGFKVKLRKAIVYHLLDKPLITISLDNNQLYQIYLQNTHKQDIRSIFGSMLKLLLLVLSMGLISFYWRTETEKIRRAHRDQDYWWCPVRWQRRHSGPLRFSAIIHQSAVRITMDYNWWAVNHLSLAVGTFSDKWVSGVYRLSPNPNQNASTASNFKHITWADDVTVH